MKDKGISRILALLVVVGLVLVACGSTPVPTEVPATEAPAAEGTPYKIGFAPGVTGGGSFLGEPERNVAEIIAAQLEEAGGIVGPDGVHHDVEVIIGDTETNPDIAVSVTRRFVEEDEVVAVIAGSVTPILAFVQPEAKLLKIAKT